MTAEMQGGSITGQIDITGTINGTITIGGGSAPKLQEKTVSPRKTQRVVVPDSGFDGLSQVTVRAAYLQDKTVNSSEESQYVTADEDYVGLNSVTVDPYSLQLKTVYPSASQQVVEADSGYDGLKSVTIQPIALQDIQVIPATTQQIITPGLGYDGIGQVTVDAVQSDGYDFVLYPNGQAITIPEMMFRNQTGMKSFKTTNDWQAVTVGPQAFDGCTGLKRVEIIALAKISTDAFHDCRNVEDYYFGPSSPGGTGIPTLSDQFAITGKSGYKIHVPASLETAWKAATNWSNFASHIVGDYVVS